MAKPRRALSGGERVLRVGPETQCITLSRGSRGGYPLAALGSEGITLTCSDPDATVIRPYVNTDLFRPC